MTAFHKQHYEVVAGVFREYEVSDEVKVKMAEIFKIDNKYFKPYKFLVESGMDVNDINAVLRTGKLG